MVTVTDRSRFYDLKYEFLVTIGVYLSVNATLSICLRVKKGDVLRLANVRSGLSISCEAALQLSAL